MLIKVKKTVEEQIEVPGEFPLYYEYGGSCYKIINEKQYLDISTRLFTNMLIITRYDDNSFPFYNEARAITPDEFYEHYFKALNQIEQLIEI